MEKQNTKKKSRRNLFAIGKCSFENRKQIITEEKRTEEKRTPKLLN